MGGNEVSDWEDIDWQRTNETVAETLFLMQINLTLNIKSKKPLTTGESPSQPWFQNQS